MDLNKEQSLVVFSQNNTLVTATAGAGKTRVLIAKVMQLINDGVTLITVITFTKSAATEIKERLITCLGTLPEGLVVGTFHSVISKHINKHSKVGLMSNKEQAVYFINITIAISVSMKDMLIFLFILRKK